MTTAPLWFAASAIDQVFDLCVVLLKAGAAFFGTTYKAINVWIFCVIWPALTLALFALAFYQRRELNKLRTGAGGGR